MNEIVALCLIAALSESQDHTIADTYLMFEGLMSK
jgi:hypothetical protein